MNLKKQRLKDLRQLKEIIKQNGLTHNFEEYAAFYYFSNEQINRIFSQINFENYHTMLSVLSSGDHAFNAIYHGIDIVDTFDVNRMTEYYALGFKKRAIECLNFEQFCLLYTLNGRDKKLLDLEDEVINNMDHEYKKFWKTYKYKMKEQRKSGQSVLYWNKEESWPEGGHYNAYLDSEQAYKYLQKRLKGAKITFTHANITELPIKFKAYDFVELSNILSYRGDIFEIRPDYYTSKLISEIYDCNLKNNGIMIYQTRGRDPLCPLYTPMRLKRAKKTFAESDGWLCVYGLQKGDK